MRPTKNKVTGGKLKSRIHNVDQNGLSLSGLDRCFNKCMKSRSETINIKQRFPLMFVSCACQYYKHISA